MLVHFCYIYTLCNFFTFFVLLHFYPGCAKWHKIKKISGSQILSHWAFPRWFIISTLKLNDTGIATNHSNSRRCHVEVQELTWLKTTFLVLSWRWLTLSSWCHILTDKYTFSSICGNILYIQLKMMIESKRTFWEKKSG